MGKRTSERVAEEQLAAARATVVCRPLNKLLPYLPSPASTTKLQFEEARVYVKLSKRVAFDSQTVLPALFFL